MEKEKLIPLVRGFTGRRVAVIGDISLDHYEFGRVLRVNPERPGSLLVKIDRSEYRLGCAGNVATNLSSLGAIVCLYGLIGKDEDGKIVRKLCEQNKVKLRYAKRHCTIRKMRTIEETHNDYLIRLDYGEDKIIPLGLSLAEKFSNNLSKEDLEAIVFSDYDKGVFKDGFAQRVIRYANSKNILTVVDPKPANILSFRKAALIRPNLKEAQMIIEEEEKDYELLAKKLKSMANAKEVAITCGRDGMVVYDRNGEFHHIKTKARQVIDVTGAGDSVAAALTLGLLAGASLIEAAHIANYAAGIVVEKQGTASTTQEELIGRILGD